MAPRGQQLYLIEVNITLGAEPKEWRIVKYLGGQTSAELVLVRALNIQTGAAEDTSEESVRYLEPDIGTFLSGSDYVGITTARATSEMTAKVYVFQGDLNEIAAIRSS